MEPLDPREAQMLALLREQHTFPCDFPFKAICRNEPAVATSVLAAIASRTGLESEVPPTLRPSRAGTYVTVSFDLRVAAAHEVIAVFRVLGSLEVVVTAL